MLQTVYQEPEILNQLCFVFNASFIYLLFFIPQYIIRHTLTANVQPKFKFIKNLIFINIFSLISVFFAYLNYWITFFEFLTFYLLIATFSLQIKKKSIKWINFSYVIFLTFIVSCYYLFLNIVNYFVSDLLIQTYQLNFEILTKPFFELSNSFFHQIVVDKNILINNDILYRKFYLFYYTLITFALSFWLFIYKKGLEKHNIIRKGKQNV